MTEGAKIRTIFEKLNHLGLKDTITALEIQYDITTISYTHITNHLVTNMFTFNDISTVKFRGRNISFAHTSQNGKKSKKESIQIPDGNVYIGVYWCGGNIVILCSKNVQGVAG